MYVMSNNYYTSSKLGNNVISIIRKIFKSSTMPEIKFKSSMFQVRQLRVDFIECQNEKKMASNSKDFFLRFILRLVQINKLYLRPYTNCPKFYLM